MAELAQMMRAELGAEHGLINTTSLPGQMTLVKRPTLDKMRNLLGVEPLVSLDEGVRRVCAFQRQLVAAEAHSNGHLRPMTLTAESGVLETPIEPIPASAPVKIAI
jgi:hypothetical protein